MDIAEKYMVEKSVVHIYYKYLCVFIYIKIINNPTEERKGNITKRANQQPAVSGKLLILHVLPILVHAKMGSTGFYIDYI